MFCPACPARSLNSLSLLGLAWLNTNSCTASHSASPSPDRQTMANSKDCAVRRVQGEKRQCKILSLWKWRSQGEEGWHGMALLACIQVNCREANADQVGPCWPVEAIDDFLLSCPLSVADTSHESLLYSSLHKEVLS